MFVFQEPVGWSLGLDLLHHWVRAVTRRRDARASQVCCQRQRARRARASGCSFNGVVWLLAKQ